ncbi:hypothetical protein LTS12_022815 [Elasticomyces elasticus]|nr:hypothetical protein LTS12_022815 [Elasticomyces elasticus]
MHRISTRPAYALQVNAADLVVAIDEEAQFRPIVDTLRLCYSFGGSAIITTLPRELFDQIEGYLIADQLAITFKRRYEAKKRHQCATFKCSDIDHMSGELRLEVLNRWLKEAGRDELKSLEPDEIDPQAVDELIDELLKYRSFGCLDSGMEIHDERADGWREMVGKVGAKDHGLFTHTGGVGASPRTITFLTLPDKPGRRSTTNASFLDVHGPSTWRETELVLAQKLNVPQKLKREETARFVRMVTKLALPGWEHANVVPELTMLTHVTVQHCRRDHKEVVRTSEDSDDDMESGYED